MPIRHLLLLLSVQPPPSASPATVVRGLALTAHHADESEYSTQRGQRDYHLRRDHAQWVVNVFDARIQPSSEAHIHTYTQPTLEACADAILADQVWPPCETCGSTRGPGPHAEEACVDCFLGTPCCEGQIVLAGLLYGTHARVTQCATCGLLFLGPHPVQKTAEAPPLQPASPGGPKPVVVALAEALEELMGVVGGEPDGDDPDSVAAWDLATAALARAKPYRPV